MTIKSAIILISVICLSACRVEVDDGYHHDTPPAIKYFDIVDSYLTNSAFEYGPYAVSPYVNDGEFEVFWEVDSYGYSDYRVELFLNDRKRVDKGIRLSSAWCGAGESCSQGASYQYCQYNTDLTINCDLPESDRRYGEKDISALFDTIPEDLYLVLEVCDDALFYCEYQTLPVEFE